MSNKSSGNFTIKLTNWNKYSLRKDVEKSKWFRLENSLFFDPSFDDFNGDEIAVFIYLLCIASYQNSEKLVHNIKNIALKARVSHSSVVSAIEKLQKIQLVELDVTPTLRHETAHKEVQDNSFCLAKGFENQDKYLSRVFLDRKVSCKQQDAWLKAFNDPRWICQEVLKAISWEIANPKKRKKDFSRFITNWLNRAFNQKKKPSVELPVGISFFDAKVDLK